ncbi:hypothetical protein ElyMa_002796100 [Elysia marginata]|uniref:Uncharacterized protein n=1 Tax=Elysia marginata TaxID=1093978 RepID=A0AAV4HRD2_9GAST|nr:hypothetical protein ElyMa_002796100 [Elysia marginata]
MQEIVTSSCAISPSTGSLVESPNCSSFTSPTPTLCKKGRSAALAQHLGLLPQGYTGDLWPRSAVLDWEINNTDLEKHSSSSSSREVVVVEAAAVVVVGVVVVVVVAAAAVVVVVAVAVVVVEVVVVVIVVVVH